MFSLTRHSMQHLAIAVACTGTCLTAAAVLPSTLRSLHDSYQALAVGTSTVTAVELMGNPKTRSDSTVLGISTCDMTWVDIAKIKYSGKFIADKLVHKSATSLE